METPVPASGTTSGNDEDEVVKVKAPFAGPRDAGENLRVVVQWAPACKVV